jgi:acetyl-CoA carboxylase carboxyltransferase component
MAGQGFDPNFIFSWPTARIGVMEGDSAVQAVYGAELEKLRTDAKPVPGELEKKIAQTRSDYERWLDVRYAAARGHCDAIIDPKTSRQVLDFAFAVACANEKTDHVPLQLLAFESKPD